MAMSETLLSTLKNYITPEFVSKAGPLVGESPERTKSGLMSAIPTVLSGVFHKGSTTEGAADLIGLVKDGGYDMGVPANHMDRLQGGVDSEKFMQAGNSALSGIFGNKLDAITQAFASRSGTKSSSALKLLGLISPFVMGTLGSRIKSQGLGASGLTGFLGEQKSSIAGMLPAGVGETLGIKEKETIATGRPEVSHVRETQQPERYARTDYETRERRHFNFLPLVLLALLALGAYWLTKKPKSEVAQAPTVAETPQAQGGVAQAPPTPAPAPAPAQPEEEKTTTQGGMATAKSSADALATVLAPDSSAALPARINAQDLTFQPGTTQLTAKSQTTVQDVADTLKQHPNSVVRIEGYTDSQGSPEMNKTLSQNRANEIKKNLVNDGVNAQQLQAVGMGAGKAVGDNATDQGRAMNRRTELLVLQR